MLKLLARNVEANSHLFALGNATTARNGEGDTPAGSNASVCGNVSPGHGDIASEQCVAVVRELDWFTFSTEEGPTDAAICDTVEGRNQVGSAAVDRAKENHLVCAGDTARRSAIGCWVCGLGLIFGLRGFQPDMDDPTLLCHRAGSFV